MPSMAPQKRLTIAQSSIYYLDPSNSDCPPVLLLHGLGSNSSSWQLQLPEMISQGFRPVVPDIPGFGQSTCYDKNWTVRCSSRLIEQFITELGINPLPVVGISMGGTIALQLAIERPDLITELILVNTFASLRPVNFKGWLYFLMRALLTIGRGPNAQADFVAQRIFPEENQVELRSILVEQIIQTDPRVYKQAMRALGLFNVQNKLKTIKMRTMVITGGNDTTVPLIVQSKLVGSIPRAVQSIIPGAGHAVIADHPEEFNRVLLNFLSQSAL